MTLSARALRVRPDVQADASLFFAGLMALALLVVVCVLQLPHAIAIDIGSGQDARYTQGFYFAEEQYGSTVRWSGPQATVTFNGLGQRPWRLRLRASGLRPSGPVQLTLSGNGEPLAQVTMGGDMQEYAFAVPASAVGPLGNLQLSLSTPTFTALPDTRDLGIMVDWLRLEPAGRGIVVPPPGLLAGVLLAVALCYLAIRRLGLSLHSALFVGAGLALGLGVALFFDPLACGYYGPWLLVGLVALALAGPRARQAAWWEWIALAVTLWSLYRFGARGLDFFRTGLPQGDFTIYYDAAKGLRLGQPLYNWEAARQEPMGPVYKYPPLFAMLLAPITTYPARTAAAAWYLLSLALLGLILAGLIWRFRSDLLRESVMPAPSRRPSKLLSVYAFLLIIGFLNFQPAWESLARGQMDALILAALVGALLLMRREAGEPWAGVCLAFATMLKLYPGLLVLYLLWRRCWRALAGFTLAFLALIVLSGIVVGWGTLWRYVTDILTVQTGAVPYPENQSFDGFLARLIIPATSATWDAILPFPGWTSLALYVLDAVTLGVTLWAFRGRVRPESDRFAYGYAALVPVIVLMWPIAWIHYQTLLILPFAVLLSLQVRSVGRTWPASLLLLASYLLVAIGNEYFVMVPWLQQGPARLLQSYKLYGVLILWASYVARNQNSERAAG
ncbi:MAG: glycosyltransferase family 87 protein [Chloroflexi bacterium]|nr:glycosyltransferase family 87 protein [Chloroflexota bacterium]